MSAPAAERPAWALMGAAAGAISLPIVAQELRRWNPPLYERFCLARDIAARGGAWEAAGSDWVCPGCANLRPPGERCGGCGR